MSYRDWSAELFSEEQVTHAMSELDDYARYEDVAILNNGTYEPAVLEIFAKLARAIGSPVVTTYGCMKVRQEKTYKDRRASAIDRLQRQAKEGKVTPAYGPAAGEKESKEEDE